MLEKYGWNAGIALIVALAAVFMFSSCSKEETETASEAEATPEMIENVEELEAEIRRVKEAEGEAAACQAVEEAEEMIFMATEVAWLHRNPGPELRPAYQQAVAQGTPMTEVFDYEAGEATVPKRYAEWDAHDKRTAELQDQMAASVSGEHRARSLEAICAISETNPHGFALVSETLDDLSGELNCAPR